MMQTILGGLVVCVGASILGSALWQAWSARWRGELRRATGTVIANELASEGDGVGYCSVVRFTTDAGQVVEIDSQALSRPAAFAVGDAVPVMYNPAAPEAARLDTFTERWFLPSILAVFGALISAAGFMVALIPF